MSAADHPQAVGHEPTLEHPLSRVRHDRPGSRVDRGQLGGGGRQLTGQLGVVLAIRVQPEFEAAPGQTHEANAARAALLAPAQSEVGGTQQPKQSVHHFDGSVRHLDLKGEAVPPSDVGDIEETPVLVVGHAPRVDPNRLAHDRLQRRQQERVCDSVGLQSAHGPISAPVQVSERDGHSGLPEARGPTFASVRPGRLPALGQTTEDRRHAARLPAVPSGAQGSGKAGSGNRRQTVGVLVEREIDRVVGLPRADGQW